MVPRKHTKSQTGTFNNVRPEKIGGRESGKIAQDKKNERRIWWKKEGRTINTRRGVVKGKRGGG